MLSHHLPPDFKFSVLAIGNATLTGLGLSGSEAVAIFGSIATTTAAVAAIVTRFRPARPVKRRARKPNPTNQPPKES